MPPVSEHFYERQELAIVDIVVPLHIVHCFGEECHWVYHILVISLHEDCTNCVVRGINFDFKWFLLIGLHQNRVFAYALLEFLKHLFFFIFPCSFDAFLEPFIEGLGDLGKSSDETSIEVTESQKAADVLDIFRSFPVLDPGYFDWVHGDSSSFQDDA